MPERFRDRLVQQKVLCADKLLKLQHWFGYLSEMSGRVREGVQFMCFEGLHFVQRPIRVPEMHGRL